MKKKTYKEMQNRMYREIKRRMEAEWKISRPVEFKVENVKIDTLKSISRIPDFILRDNYMNAMNFAKRQIAREMVDALIDGGYLQFAKHHDIDPLCTEIEGRLRVTKSNAPYNE